MHVVRPTVHIGVVFNTNHNIDCTNLTSNEMFSLAIVCILTADVYTETIL
jgi:hypothetical protein